MVLRAVVGVGPQEPEEVGCDKASVEFQGSHDCSFEERPLVAVPRLSVIIAARQANPHKALPLAERFDGPGLSFSARPARFLPPGVAAESQEPRPRVQGQRRNDYSPFRDWGPIMGFSGSRHSLPPPFG